MKYSEIIKNLRVKMLLTQTEFAAILGVTFESVNRWENGKNEPSFKIKRKILELAKKNNVEVE